MRYCFQNNHSSSPQLGVPERKLFDAHVKQFVDVVWHVAHLGEHSV